LPYRRPAGLLAVRVWRRPVHAEVGDVQVGGDRIRFVARLVGADFGTDAPEVELRCRADRTRAERFTARRCGPDAFRATVPAAALVARRATDHDLWDAWLGYADDAVAVRLARLLDDVLDKRAAYAFPSALATGGVRVEPYFTSRNEFSFRVIPA
jgi:hypothetical protein